MARIGQRSTKERRQMGRWTLAGAVAVAAACSSTGGTTTSTTGAQVPPATSAPASTPSPSPGAAGTIVFTLNLPGDEDGALYAIDPDGANQRLLVSSACCVQVSADGTRLVDTVLLDDGRISAATIDRDGSFHDLPLPDGMELPGNALSPDGRWVASEGIVAPGSGLDGVYTRNTADGGDLVRVSTGGLHDWPIAYSPDGTKILFVRLTQPGDDAEGPMDLFVANVDGTGVTRLNPSGTTTSYLDTPVVTTASWSPDGRQVAFVAVQGSWRDVRSRWVYVVDADGSDPRRVFGPATLWGAEWSPDGRWIAVTSPSTGAGTNVSIVRPDGSGLIQVSGKVGAAFAYGPRWSPDSSEIVLVAGNREFDDTNLWIVGLDGTALQLTHVEGHYEEYVWSASAPPVG
jgi:Tol biopolymer transport system component